MPLENICLSCSFHAEQDSPDFDYENSQCARCPLSLSPVPITDSGTLVDRSSGESRVRASLFLDRITHVLRGKRDRDVARILLVYGDRASQTKIAKILKMKRTTVQYIICKLRRNLPEFFGDQK